MAPQASKERRKRCCARLGNEEDPAVLTLPSKSPSFPPNVLLLSFITEFHGHWSVAVELLLNVSLRIKVTLVKGHLRDFKTKTVTVDWQTSPSLYNATDNERTEPVTLLISCFLSAAVSISWSQVCWFTQYTRQSRNAAYLRRTTGTYRLILQYIIINRLLVPSFTFLQRWPL